MRTLKIWTQILRRFLKTFRLLKLHLSPVKKIINLRHYTISKFGKNKSKTNLHKKEVDHGNSGEDENPEDLDENMDLQTGNRDSFDILDPETSLKAPDNVSDTHRNENTVKSAGCSSFDTSADRL